MSKFRQESWPKEVKNWRKLKGGIEFMLFLGWAFLFFTNFSYYSSKYKKGKNLPIPSDYVQRLFILFWIFIVALASVILLVMIYARFSKYSVERRLCSLLMYIVMIVMLCLPYWLDVTLIIIFTQEGGIMVIFIGRFLFFFVITLIGFVILKIIDIIYSIKYKMDYQWIREQERIGAPRQKRKYGKISKPREFDSAIFGVIRGLFKTEKKPSLTQIRKILLDHEFPTKDLSARLEKLVEQGKLISRTIEKENGSTFLTYNLVPFDPKEFQDHLEIKVIVEKLNRQLGIKKRGIMNRLKETLQHRWGSRTVRLMERLKEALKDKELAVPASYVLSVVAEINPSLLSKNVIREVKKHLVSSDSKLRLNSATTLGFLALKNNDWDAMLILAKLLLDESEDVRDNAVYFLFELIERDQSRANWIKNFVVKSLLEGQSEENMLYLLEFLERCDELSFKQLIDLRISLKRIVGRGFMINTSSDLYSVFSQVLTKFFPFFEKMDLSKVKSKDIVDLFDSLFIALNHNVTENSKKLYTSINNYMTTFKKLLLHDKELLIVIKSEQTGIIYAIEFERDKLIESLEKHNVLSPKDLIALFSHVLKDDLTVSSVIYALIEAGYVDGHYSNSGYFYPYIRIKQKIAEVVQIKGKVDLNDYTHIPKEMVKLIIENVSKELHTTLLKGKEKNIYFSLAYIQEQINSLAKKTTMINLQRFRDILIEKDFLTLISNLPDTYMTKYRRGLYVLTIAGESKVKEEIIKSRIVGFYDVYVASRRLGIEKKLLREVLKLFVDERSGVFDRSGKVFYYSNYIKCKIDEITKFLSDSEQEKSVHSLAKELNIDESYVTTKLEENFRSIAEEIKKKEQINLVEYGEKIGLDKDALINFVESLGLSYLKKGEELIFNKAKIKRAKNDIKSTLLKHSKELDYIEITSRSFDITPNLVKSLIEELRTEKMILGMFYQVSGKNVFLMKKGIKKLVLENEYKFKLRDLFPDKELSGDEIKLLKTIVKSLINKNKLKGEFDNELLEFKSNDILLSTDYDDFLQKFKEMIDEIIRIFELSFHKIKVVLTKRKTLKPREITFVQKQIDFINAEQSSWRTDLEVFVRKSTERLLRSQGLTLRKYREKSKSLDIKDDIKLFKNDPLVIRSLNKFESWVKLYNKLEVKYPSIVYFQKRLKSNPTDEQSRKKLNELLMNLNLA